jgi:hypothetical protein
METYHSIVSASKTIELDEELDQLLQELKANSEDNIAHLKELTQKHNLYSLFWGRYEPKITSKTISQFQKLDQIRHLDKVSAAGIPINITKISRLYLWMVLLPLLLSFENHREIHNLKRLRIGIVGSPGAGKTVFSEILKLAFNLVFGDSYAEGRFAGLEFHLY